MVIMRTTLIGTAVIDTMARGAGDINTEIIDIAVMDTDHGPCAQGHRGHRIVVGHIVMGTEVMGSEVINRVVIGTAVMHTVAAVDTARMHTAVTHRPQGHFC